MQRVMSALLVSALCLTGLAGAGVANAQVAADGPNLLTPYDPARYTDLYANPGGPVTGATGQAPTYSDSSTRSFSIDWYSTCAVCSTVCQPRPSWVRIQSR